MRYFQKNIYQPTRYNIKSKISDFNSYNKKTYHLPIYLYTYIYLILI